MARTAIFVSKHGGQSEIVLRVKQGDNPTFGFLMPDHRLHPYFRFLVDHQELLSSNSIDEESKADSSLDQASSGRGSGALSLLGTVYGSGEDEDGEMENATEAKRMESGESGVAINKKSTDGPDQKESSLSVSKKDDTVSKHLAPLKEKASLIKRNQSITSVKPGTVTGLKKESDASTAEKSRAYSLPPILKVEVPVVEPPSDLKRVVDKIVEFILRNGRQFETVLVEQDVKHGRFPFLLPSNLYHPYYLEALQKAEKVRFSLSSVPYNVLCIFMRFFFVRHLIFHTYMLLRVHKHIYLRQVIPFNFASIFPFSLMIGLDLHIHSNLIAVVLQSDLGSKFFGSIF